MRKWNADSAPVPGVILCAQIAALALTRRLGRAGARVALVDAAAAPAAFRSRYAQCRVRPDRELSSTASESDAAWLSAVGPARAAVIADEAQRPALMATSDDAVLFMSRHRARLRAEFRFLLPKAELLDLMLDKRQLHSLAAAHDVAVPISIELDSEADLGPAARALGFPCLLKSAFGKLGGGVAGAAVPEAVGKRRVESAPELQSAYCTMARHDRRLMLQEYLPGGAGQVALYNAYFNAASEPVAVFIGRKLRQYPLEFGTASLSAACPVPGLAEPLTAFLEAIHYVGPVDIGLKWDARHLVYKLLDLNPRLGQNYRTFVAPGPERADLGWLLYRELAEGALPAPAAPLSARRKQWRIVDSDLRACRQLRRRGERSRWGAAAEWMRFFRHAHECAFWSWRDLAPALAPWTRLLRPDAQPAAAAQARGSGPRGEAALGPEPADAAPETRCQAAQSV